MSFQGTVKNWPVVADVVGGQYKYIAKNCKSYEELMNLIGYKYTVLCQLNTTIESTSAGFLQHNNMVGDNYYNKQQIFMRYMSQIHRPYWISPAAEKLRSMMYYTGWEEDPTCQLYLSDLRDRESSGSFGRLPITTQLQLYNGLLYEWDAIKSGKPLRYVEPSILNISTDDQYYRLEPGGTRVLFASNDKIRHDLLVVCPNHLVERYFPNENKRNSAIEMAKIYIDRKLLRKNKKSLDVLEYTGHEINSFNINPTYQDPHGNELRSTYVWMKVIDAAYESNMHESRRFKLDMDALAKLDFVYKDRTMTLSDGTELFTVADDYGIHTSVPTERPTLWLTE